MSPYNCYPFRTCEEKKKKNFKKHKSNKYQYSTEEYGNLALETINNS